MPTYDFKCTGCGTIFEDFMNMSAPNPPCPNCGGNTEKTFPLGTRLPGILIPGSYYDPSRVDEGIPFGEVPGDDDYYDLDSPLCPKP